MTHRMMFEAFLKVANVPWLGTAIFTFGTRGKLTLIRLHG